MWLNVEVAPGILLALVSFGCEEWCMQCNFPLQGGASLASITPPCPSLFTIGALQTVSKAALPRHSTEDGLLSIMHQAHQLLVALHGPLDTFLDSDGGDGVEVMGRMEMWSR